ncbi:MAG TPA: hypothetical protein PLW09_09165, partial [Candidatus Kapabacteria bacterium]|nr:hypothetical protein [Candidatus Kapabacteria bacterium]
MANIKKTNKPAQSIQGKIIEIVQKNKSQLFFILTVGIVMVIYYSITGTQWFRQDMLPSYLQILARITSA